MKVQTLPAKFVELQLSGEVLPDDVLDLLLHLWLVDVSVDLGELLHLVCNEPMANMRLSITYSN